MLAAAAVGLGALGIVVEVTLRCVPTFLLRAEEGSATLPEVLESWPDWTAESDHVDLHWFPQTEWVLTKRNHRIDGPPEPLSGWPRLVDDELLANGLLGLINEIGTRRPGCQPRINQLAGQALTPRASPTIPPRSSCLRDGSGSWAGPVHRASHSFVRAPAGAAGGGRA